MAVQTSYPGVYVQEVPSGVRTIAGVSTSIGLFIGVAKRGPLNKPVRCFNYTLFKNTFGEDNDVGQLAEYVKLFFLNGGTDCWVMRIAKGATTSGITLRDEGNTTNVLRLDAKNAGAAGDMIRVAVSYKGARPEANFTLDLFRWETDSSGNTVMAESESWPDLSMDPASPRYVQTYLTQQSKLVKATVLVPAPAPGAALGLSLSGRPVADSGGFAGNWKNILGTLATTNTFRISVAGKEYVDVNLGTIVVGTQAALIIAIKGAIEAAYLAKGIAGITVTVSFIGPATARRLQIQSGSNGDVLIRQGNPMGGMTDLAVPLMLGTEQGGLEVSGIANLRPAPTGITVRAAVPANITLFDVTAQSAFTTVTLESILSSNNTLVPQAVAVNLVTTVGADMLSKDNTATTKNDHSDGIREKLQLIAAAINNFPPPAGHIWPWRAEVWGYRLAIIPKNSAPDNLGSAAIAFPTVPAFPLAGFTKNVHYYSLGTAGTGIFQTLGTAGFDGTPPDLNTYDNAYASLDPEIDLFNMMILAPVNGAVAPVQQLYGNASVFCQKRRAFLLMDPDPLWSSASDAVAGIPGMRIGLVKDYSAIFFPEITVNQDGLNKNIGPSGALAGLFARIDSTRGVWKAPAGTEADLRGITGLRQPFTDAENGILNPRAINTIRVFPNGIVNWGARTNQGDDDTPHDYKYIPVRRTALFIEESLYRGLKWVVFEPNDEPLWAQIRLNVGAFMHNLFRQGAFQGVRKNDAYFVKCDNETTTQNDINLGVVNIWIGFAPLKPAEFVVLYLQQIAGNILV